MDAAELTRLPEGSERHRTKVIKGVLAIRQNGHPVYIMTVTGDQLVSLAIVERFSAAESGGINREFREDHATDIAEAMEDEGLLWLDSSCVNLKGDWTFDETRGQFKLGPDALMSMDDGQHRLGGLRMARPEVRSNFVAIIVATQGLSREMRLRVFMMQNERLRFDPRLQLAQHAALGNWNGPLGERAYQFLNALNDDEDSPLRGRIGVTESAPLKDDEGRALLNGKGLHTTLRRVLGKNSVLSPYAESPDMQLRVIKDLLRAASIVWRPAWNSDKHVLSSAGGINGILSLLNVSNSFKIALGPGVEFDQIVAVLTHAKGFSWTKEKRNNLSAKRNAQDLNKSIGDGLVRAGTMSKTETKTRG